MARDYLPSTTFPDATPYPDSDGILQSEWRGHKFTEDCRNDPPRWRVGQDGAEMVRTFFYNEGDNVGKAGQTGSPWREFVLQLLGKPKAIGGIYTGGGQLERITPHRVPLYFPVRQFNQQTYDFDADTSGQYQEGWTFAYAVDIDSLTYMGVQGMKAIDADQQARYSDPSAKCMRFGVTYRAVTYRVREDGEVGDDSYRKRFVTRFRKPALQYITVPGSFMLFEDADANKRQPAGQLPVQQNFVDLVYRWHYVPYEPIWAYWYMGRCMPAAFEIFEPGTLVFMTWETIPKATFFGIHYDIDYHFRYFPRGANAFPRADSNAVAPQGDYGLRYQKVSSTGNPDPAQAGRRPFPTKDYRGADVDFSNLFRPTLRIPT